MYYENDCCSLKGVIIGLNVVLKLLALLMLFDGGMKGARASRQSDFVVPYVQR
jgi:hypothetical protein